MQAWICPLKNSKAKFQVAQSYELSKGRGIFFGTRYIKFSLEVSNNVIRLSNVYFIFPGGGKSFFEQNLGIKLLMHKHISCVRHYYVGLCAYINLIKT